MPYVRRRRIGFDPQSGRPAIVRDVVTAGGTVTVTDFCDPADCPDHDVLAMHYDTKRPPRAVPSVIPGLAKAMKR